MSFKVAKEKKGITLIALVITIIVLLILAGVTIATLTGENGILTRATEAREQTSLKSAEEEIKLAILSSSIDGRGNVDEISLKQELDKLGATYADDLSTISYKGYTFSFDLDTGSIEKVDGKYLVTSRNRLNYNDPDYVDGYLNTNGGIETLNNESSITTGFIPVEEGENIIVSVAYTSWTEIARRVVSFRICGYDSNKEFVSNSYQNNVSSYAVPEGMNYVRITLGNTYLSSEYSCQIENSTIPTYYQEYFKPYYSDVKPAEWKTNIEEYTDVAYLPPEIYVAQGTEINLYNNQICPIATDGYVFTWSCDSNIGESTSAYNGNFSINTNANIGNYTLSLTINDGKSNIWSGNTTIKIVNNELNKNISLLCIGDSLSNGKPWLNSLVSLSNNKIQLLGTRGSSNILHEGRSGFTSAQYLMNTAYEEETSHAFYNQATNRFDWNYYKSTTGNNPDQVVLFLGTNGIKTDPTGNANCIKQIIDYIRQDDQDIPIYVVNTLYGGTGEYDENIKVFNLMVRLHQLLDEYNNLTFVPLAITHDSVANFEGQTDKVHPNNNGYTQFANTIYSEICGYNNK